MEVEIMYFANMLGEEGVKVFDRGSSKCYPFVNTVEGTIEGFVSLKDGKLVVTNEGENLFLKGITGEKDDAVLTFTQHKPRKGKKQRQELTFAEIKDTDENPLIIVLCREISLYNNIPTGMKYIYVGEGYMLACLIYGACDFDGATMRRCSTTELDNRQRATFTGRDLQKFSLCIDRETEYCYMRDVVNHVELDYQGEEGCSRYSTVSSMVNMFDERWIKDAQEQNAKMLLRREAIEKRKEEEKKAKEEAIAKKRYDKESDEASFGAAMFLKAVNSIKTVK